MMRHFAVALGFGLLPMTTLAQTAPTEAPADAQAQAPTPVDPDTTYLAARNQLGLLQYCEEQGFSGPEAVAAQEQMVGMLPEGDTAAGDAAQQAGSEGTVSLGTSELSLTDAAESQGSTAEETCQQIEAAVNEVAPTLPQG